MDVKQLEEKVLQLEGALIASRASLAHARQDRDVAMLAVHALQRDNDELRERLRAAQDRASGQLLLQVA